MDQAARKLSIADGRMTVDGLPGSFVQDAGRLLRLEADGLVAVAGQHWREGALHEAGRIEARAWPVGASLARLGFPGEAQTLALTIRPFPHDGGKAPLLRLGLADDAPALDDSFTAELFLPQPLFAALREDLAAGRAGLIAFSASTNLWLREDARADEPAAFHLGLAADGLRTASAHGRVESVEWRPAPATESGVGAAQAAAGLHDEEPPEDPVAEQLRRINWSLKQLLIVLAFLMLIVALK